MSSPLDSQLSPSKNLGVHQFWWLYTHKGHTLTNVFQTFKNLGFNNEHIDVWSIKFEWWNSCISISKNTHNINKIWCSWIDLTSCTHNILYTIMLMKFMNWNYTMHAQQHWWNTWINNGDCTMHMQQCWCSKGLRMNIKF